MLFRATTELSVMRPLIAGVALVAVLGTPAPAAPATLVDPATPAGSGENKAVQVRPSALHMVLRSGQRRERAVWISNTGSAAAAWELADGTGRPARPAAAGTLLRSWHPTGVAVGWGIGSESGNVWISDADLLRNDSFTPDGQRRDEGWPTPWASDSYPGPVDMAYVPDRGLMCQVKVGGDNGIHCWDPRTGEVTADIVGDFPWTAAAQRGLAYRPDDDTFYVGGWDQGIIYHIQGLGHRRPGRVIGRCTPADRAVSGLGWSAGFNRLWVAGHNLDDLIYAVDPDTCRTLTVLTPPDQEPFTGGGLDVDARGALWIMSIGSFTSGADPGTAYQVGSGLPVFTDAPWLSVTPAAGVLGPGASRRLTVRVDASGLSPGRHRATLYVLTDAQSSLTTVPVWVSVKPAP